MSRDFRLRVAAELSFSAGVTGLVVPRLTLDLSALADLLFIAFVIAAFAAAIPFMGSAYRSAVIQDRPSLDGRRALALSIHCVIIAFAIAVARTGVIGPIAAPVTVLGILLVLAAAVRSAKVQQ